MARTTRSFPSGLGGENNQTLKGAKEIYYPGAPHGLTATLQDQVNADLLAFLRS